MLLPKELTQIDLSKYSVKVRTHENGKLTARPSAELFNHIIIVDTDREKLAIRMKYRIYKELLKRKMVLVCGCGKFLDKNKPWMNCCSDCLKGTRELYPWEEYAEEETEIEV